jgi:hypothetical protein
MKRLRSNFTYANVISTLCLFLLLGGGAALAATQLAKNSIGSRQLEKNAVTTAKIKNGSVTAAKIKDGAVTGAKIQTSSLGTVPSATNATNAATLGGRSAATFAPAQAEPLHFVGAPGEAPFVAGWKNVESPAAYWKDPFGTVHLEGQATRSSGTNTAIFVLPVGFRPAEEGFFEVYSSNDDKTTTLEVAGDGTVELFSPEPGDEAFVALDGISFRAAGT